MKIAKLIFKIVAGSAFCGCVLYLCAFLILERKVWNDSNTVDLVRAICETFSIFVILYGLLFAGITISSKEAYDQMDVWKERVKNSYDVEELENLKELLISYRHSMKCFSLVHMKYATQIIMLINGKIDGLKHNKI